MTPDGLDRLTENQKIVLRLVADGFETGEIAQRLSLTESAVIDRIERARSKSGGLTRKRLARLLIEAERGAALSQIGPTPVPIGGPKSPEIMEIPPAATVGGVREMRAEFTHTEQMRRIARYGFADRSGMILASAVALLVLIVLIKPAWDGIDWIGTLVARLLR